jgi:excisionase family DNA binding protein
MAGPVQRRGRTVDLGGAVQPGSLEEPDAHGAVPAVDGRAPEGRLAGSPYRGRGSRFGIGAAGGPASAVVEDDAFVGGEAVMLSGAQRAEDHAGLPRLLDVNEVAEVLGVNVRHVRRLVFEHRIPYLKWGRLVRFDPREIDRWLRSVNRPASRS